MGVDVVLMQVSQRGTSSRKRRLTPVDFVQDGADVFAGLCVNSGLPMLNRVDPYRTQILTQADMPQFVSEIATTYQQVTDQGERDILQKIRELGERCSATADLELHLQGD
ncbi:hypothetical protein ACIBL6_19825 [Streptomyces sp. NPDC050400]|uniref:hypothetical protein n=1 Tax=Streptomyces sp. NPDC050400 TaxID=3365610 RepID=UPI00378FD2D5